MPIDPSMSHSEIVKELMDAYKAKGKIKNTTITSKEEVNRVRGTFYFL